MLNKKGVAWKYVIEFIVGAIILGVIIIIFFPELAHYPQKMWNLTKTKVSGEFEPYGEELTKDETSVRNSVNALVCTINSVTVGDFGYDDNKICPQEGLIIDSAKTPTASVVGRVTGNNKAQKVHYGNTIISCEGISSEFLKFSGATREEVIKLIGDAVEKTWERGNKVELKNEFTRGAYFNPKELYALRGSPITIKEVKDYLNSKNSETAETAAKQLKIKNLENIPWAHEGCIYFDKDVAWNDIIINDCTKDNPIDSFSCSVEGFELPQDISLAQKFLQAFGDPNWLVYYEKFPEEATSYWQKEWTDMFSIYTIGFVTVSGLMNIGFAGGGTKVATKAGKEVVEKAGKEVVEKVAKEAAEAGSEYLLKRATTASLKNIIRSVVVEEESKLIYGVGKETAEAVGDIVAKRMGKKVGKESFEAVEKEIKEDVLEIVTRNVKKVDPNFDRAYRGVFSPAYGTAGEEELKKAMLRDYREKVAKLIVEGGEASDGTIIKGTKEVFEKELTREVTKEVLEKQTYKNFFKQLFKKGTQELDQKLLEESAEKSLKRLVALKGINEGLVDKSFRAGLEKVERILLQGTTGIKEGDSVLSIVAKQIPLALPSNKWLLTGPGYLIGMAGATTFRGIPKWVINHPLPTALLISVLIDMIDSTNEKFVPVGINSIAATPPNLLGSKMISNLVDESTRYFIRNKIKPASPMYLVSPCKANIKVFKRKCDCANNPQANVFDFGGGLMNVEPGTITLKEYDKIAEINKQRWNEFETIRKEFPKEEDYLETEYLGVEKNFKDFVISSGLEPAGLPKDALSFLTEYVDYDNAVKQCYDRTIVGSIFNIGKKLGYGFTEISGISNIDDKKWEKAFKADINYNIDCIELETDRVDGYCYDYFPRTEWIRYSVVGLSLVADAAIIGLTGGIATPLALVGSGMAFAAVDVVLENFEKWP